jgi:protein SCO1/2
MTSFAKKNRVGIIAASFAAFFITCVFIGYAIMGNDNRLPIYSPSEINRELVDESLWEVAGGHTVSDFDLTSQLGEPITAATFEGKVYVVSFFFASCASICPKMSKSLGHVQERFLENDDVMILSHSVLPDHDTVEVLAKYGERFKVNSDKWLLATGSQDSIFKLARKSYFAVIKGEQGAESGFIHTENFVLIDKEKRIRGYYNGIAKTEVDQMMDDIDRLLLEYVEE